MMSHATNCGPLRACHSTPGWGSILVRPADDLQSLVKSVFVLTHPSEMRQLNSADRHNIGCISTLWSSWLEGRPTWTAIMEAAAAGDYAAVKEKLSSWLE